MKWQEFSRQRLVALYKRIRRMPNKTMADRIARMCAAQDGMSKIGQAWRSSKHESP
jgi:hypothetical protein